MKLKLTSIALLSLLVFACSKEKNTKNALNTVLVKDSLEIYKKLYDEAAYFSIDKNENAQKQFAPQPLEEVMTKVVQDFSNLNQLTGGNPLLPVDKNGQTAKVNKLSVINHQWIIIDFYGEGILGELLIKYNYTNNSTTTFKVIDTVIY
ncbi:hydrolase [Myroides sp. JBRI-B21084]|uniref:hydrolase n=1 Tax=Myroides sp. JBRI-B21084 TaxID=3119977 RepID=UPI0026E3D789|nr:hydrolase [Paenimyroides cloacae]WKW45804.1 hydrolase [Paenimyroides cloacae]